MNAETEEAVAVEEGLKQKATEFTKAGAETYFKSVGRDSVEPASCSRLAEPALSAVEVSMLSEPEW